MAVSTLNFNGKNTAIPSAYSMTDASAFNTPSSSASGIVALLDLSVGGKPYNAVTAQELQRASNIGQTRRLFKSGDLLELSAPLFAPAKDVNIPAGAQQIVYVKVNPAAQSQADFANGVGPALRLKSKDYGAFTTQLKASIANATTGGGKLVTLALEDTTEVFDLVGNDAKFSLSYNGGADGASAIRANAISTAFTIEFDRIDAGQDTGVVQAAPAASLEVVSSNAGDTAQVATIYGLNALNVPTIAQVTLNGLTAVAVAGTWNLITGFVLSGVALGTVDLQVAGGGANVVVLTAGQTNKGRVALDIPVASSLTIVANGASTRKAVVRGANSSGVALAEVVTLNGTTPVNITGAFARLNSIEMLNVETARQTTIAGLTINAPVASYPNLQKLKDLISANADFTFISLISNPKEFLVADLDYVSDVNILNPVTASFFAQLFDIVSVINNQSQLCVAERITGGTGAPSNTVGSVFLAGGHEGDPLNIGVPTATFNDWQNAIDLLKQVFVNTIVIGTSDASVHAAAEAHCQFMGGTGRMERDLVVAAAANESDAQLLTRVKNLNSRHVRVCGQEVLLFNLAGERVWQPPKFQAAICAGMQAGAPVGEPLTKKYANVLGFRQHSSWNPVDDAEKMVRGQLWFFEEDTVGYPVIRNVTTHMSDDTLVYIEASMNQAANRAAFEYRTRMQKIVGKKGFARTVSNADNASATVLDELVRDEVIADYQKPTFELNIDVLAIEVGMAIIAPINFIPIRIYLNTVSLTA